MIVFWSNFLIAAVGAGLVIVVLLLLYLLVDWIEQRYGFKTSLFAALLLLVLLIALAAAAMASLVHAYVVPTSMPIHLEYQP